MPLPQFLSNVPFGAGCYGCCAPCDEPADSRRVFMRCLGGSDPATAGGRPLPPYTSGLLLPRTDDGRELLQLIMLPESATLHETREK